VYRFITTISAWTEPGCKNADNLPHASLGDSVKNALPGWCETKKAGAIFFWLAFGVFIPRDVFFGLTRPLVSGFWLASFVLLILDWRAGNLGTPPRDPPFTRPDADVEEGEEGEHSYQPVANTIAYQRTRVSRHTITHTLRHRRLQIPIDYLPHQPMPLPAPPASPLLNPPPTVSPQQTRAPTAHQHIPLHLPLLPHPQPARITLPRDQVWTRMARSRILPQVGLAAYRRRTHLLRRTQRRLE
jgi:hypothetical protein